MGIRHYIDKEKGVGFSCWCGLVTAREFLEQTRRNVANPDWPPSSRRVLTDLRYASVDENFDPELVSQIVSLYQAHPDQILNLRAAIVAGSLFEKAKIFEQMVSGFSPSVIVFNDLDRACTWLGVDAQAAERTLQEMRRKEQDETSAPGNCSEGFAFNG